MSNKQLREQIIFLKKQLKKCRDDVKKKSLKINELANILKQYSVPSSIDVNKSQEGKLTQSSDESILSYYSDDEFVTHQGGIRKKPKKSSKKKTRKRKKKRKRGRTKRKR